MKVIIGIDPGITGGIAVLNSDSGEVVLLKDMPVEIEIVKGKTKQRVCGAGIQDIIGRFPVETVDMVFLERVWARPGQGVTSMFNFGRAYGVVEGAVRALGYPVSYVLPYHWKRSAGLMGAEKDASRSRVLTLYPYADVHRKKDNGRADAVLIARFGG